MSTSKHIDILCFAVIALALGLTIFFITGGRFGNEATAPQESAEAEYFSREDLDAGTNLSEATKIVLADEQTTVAGNGACYEKGSLRIIEAGKYVLSGTLSEGQIIIDTTTKEAVQLILSGADITCPDNAAILAEQAGKVYLTLAEGTENTLSSGKTYSAAAETAKIDGVVFSREDLTVNGSGFLQVTGAYAHGIVGNDKLKITGGNITVSAARDCIHVHDCVCIKTATLNLTAGDDGITVANDEGTDYLYIESGNIKITDAYEGLEATTVTVAGGTLDITANDDGINAMNLIEMTGGSVKIVNENGRDGDGLDSNHDILISGGKLFISVAQTGGNTAIDYGSENQGKCLINGGTVIACGSHMMLEPIATESEQAFITEAIAGDASSEIKLTAADGAELLSETIPVGFSVVTLSVPELKQGEACTLTVGDTVKAITVGNDTENSVADNSGDFKTADNQNQNGAPPDMPDGENQNGAPPDKPDGENQNGAPPDKPDGENQNGAPPDKPDGENRGGMPRPDGNTAAPPDEGMTPPSAALPEQKETTAGNDNGKTPPSSEGNREQDTGQSNRPSEGNRNLAPEDKQTTAAVTGASAKAQWALIGISAFALAAGLFIAIKKKY